MTRLVQLFDELRLHGWRTYGDYLAYGTRKIWASWKACDLVAQKVIATPHKLTRDGSSDAVQVPGLSQLLQYPNQAETFGDMLYRLVFHLKLTGNAFLLKSEATMRGDRPKELFVLNPKRMTPVKDGRGELIGWQYTHCGGFMKLDLEEVIHFKRPHADNDHMGLGDMEAGEELLSDFVHRVEWGKQFWKNGAAPSSVMINEEVQTDDESWAKAKTKFMAEYGGRQNAGKVAWLSGKWSFQRLGMTAQEMQDLERIKLTVEQIFQLHGVPLTVAGVRDAANRATAEVDNQRFNSNTVWPLICILRDTLNTDLVSGWGQNLRLEFDATLLLDIAKVVTDLTPLFDRGCISINELREKAGLNRLEEPMFDAHYVLAAYVPLDLSGIAASDTAAEEASRAVRRFTEKVLNETRELPPSQCHAPAASRNA